MSLFMSFPCGPIDVSIFKLFTRVLCLYSKSINIYSSKMKNVDLEMPYVFSCVSYFDRLGWGG